MIDVTINFGQFVFGIVWGIRDYGLMINTPNAWGLLHKSNIPAPKYPIDSFKDFASIGDVLLLKVTRTNDYNASFGFSAEYPERPSSIRVFYDQFGSVNVEGKIVNKNRSEDLIYLQINFDGCQNPLFGYLKLDSFDESEKRELLDLHNGDCIDVQINGYDYEKKKLICNRKSRTKKSWAQLQSSNAEHYLSGQLTNIYLNAIEISLDGHGKVMIPFESLPGYSRGYERLLAPIKQKVDIIIDFKDENHPITVATDLFDADAQKKYEEIQFLSEQKTVIFLGATGAGKSSLINSIIRVAKVDIPFAETGLIDPTTQSLDQYKCLNLSMFDSPGVGESEEQDKKTLEMIRTWFQENRKSLPIVVVVFDANSRDYGSTFRLVREIKDFCSGRLIFCINRVDTLFPYGVFAHDITGTGNGKDRVIHKIEEKVSSVVSRMSESVGVQGLGVASATQVATDKGRKVDFNIKRLLEKINSF